MNSILQILLFTSLILYSSAYTPWNYLRYQPRILRETQVCTEEGFFRDSVDCQKFYRCAILPSTPGNRLTKYEFRCPDGTIFDESVATCNYASQMENPPSNCRYVPPIFLVPGGVSGVVGGKPPVSGLPGAGGSLPVSSLPGGDSVSG